MRLQIFCETLLARFDPEAEWARGAGATSKFKPPNRVSLLDSAIWAFAQGANRFPSNSAPDHTLTI
jgi:hypothetical protein